MIHGFFLHLFSIDFYHSAFVFNNFHISLDYHHMFRSNCNAARQYKILFNRPHNFFSPILFFSLDRKGKRLQARSSIWSARQRFSTLLWRLIYLQDMVEKKKTRLCLSEKYMNITLKMIKYFVSNCETCQKKKCKPNKGLVVQPLKTHNYGSRGQVDLISMESSPDRNFINILNYQDHFTKFLFLKPLKSRKAAETAYNVIDILTVMGAPTILQSDNGREFTAAVVNELKEMWPQLTIVHGKARHPQSQGSVVDNNTSQWAEGLRFVMLQKISFPHRNLNNR